MNRRAFLMTLGAALIPKIIRVNTPAFIPSAAQVEFMSIPTVPAFYGGMAGGGKSYLLMHYKVANVYETLLRSYGEKVDRP